MADLHGFDANEFEPTSDFEAIPSGKYEAVVTDSEMKQTRAGTGEYLQLTFQITDGQYKNRLLWARLNLSNPNPTAVQIARAELSALCRAVDVMAPKDSTELHNLPVIIHVRCRRREDTGDVVNEIKGYSRKDNPPTASVTAAPNNRTPPWKRPAQAAG